MPPTAAERAARAATEQENVVLSALTPYSTRLNPGGFSTTPTERVAAMADDPRWFATSGAEAAAPTAPFIPPILRGPQPSVAQARMMERTGRTRPFVSEGGPPARDPYLSSGYSDSALDSLLNRSPEDIERLTRRVIGESRIRRGGYTKK